jgi:hypothetical protein
LLERHGYAIEVVESRRAALGGANFMVRFIEDEG